MATKVKSIRLSEELWDKLDTYADQHGTTVNGLMQNAVAQLLDTPVIQDPLVARAVTQPVTQPRVQPQGQVQPNAYRNEGKDFSKYKQATNGKGKKA